MSINRGKRLYHSSIRICGEKTVYVDPWKIVGEPHDADLILVTHDHGDHYSPEDIEKISRDNTVLAVPRCMADRAPAGAALVEPAGSYCLAGLPVETVAAYNIGRPFHPKERNYVGYIVAVDGVRYYVAGDTDLTPENAAIRCDVAFVPCGGVYTMDVAGALELVSQIRPQVAVPTHYGTVTDSEAAGEEFCRRIPAGIAAELQQE